MKPLKKKRNKKALLEQNVNITPLMDVLTVLLFFLIKTFTLNAPTMAFPSGMQLPSENAKLPPEESVIVTLSQTELKADGNVLAILNDGKFQTKFIGTDGRTIVPLENFLITQIKKRNKVFEGVGDANLLPPGKLLIMADKKLKFGTLKYLFHTATVSGYADYQFLIKNPE